MSNFKLKGTGVALITPFKQDQSIDWMALEKILEHCIAGGLDYLVVQGTTGESPTITPEEKDGLIGFIAEKVNGRCPLVLGIGGNSTHQVEYALQHSNLDPFEAVLSVCPYYNKPNQSGIIQHYTRLADMSPRPIILYNVPGRTGTNMTAETQLKLAEHPNIIATKEASGDLEQMMTIVQGKPEGFELISGDDSLTFPIMGIGGVGVISVIAQLIPNHFSGMVNAALNGDWDNAREMHYKSLDLCRDIFIDGSPGGIKFLMKHAGLCDSPMRLPLAPIGQEAEQTLLNTWKQFNA